MLLLLGVILLVLLRLLLRWPQLLMLQLIRRALVLLRRLHLHLLLAIAGTCLGKLLRRILMLIRVILMWLFRSPIVGTRAFVLLLML